MTTALPPRADGHADRRPDPASVGCGLAVWKASLVAKLKGARDRKRREKGICEGRKSHAEKRPGTVALAKKPHRASPKTGKRMSLRKISAALAEAGHLNENGRLFNPNAIKRMLEG